MCAISALYCTVVLGAYLVMKLAPLGCSMYRHQYLWPSTVVFMQGLAPSCVVMAASVVGIAVIMWLLCETKRTTPRRKLSGAELQDRRLDDFTSWERTLVPVMLHSIHICVMLGMNIGYVAAVLAGVSGSALYGLQFCISCLKLVWVRDGRKLFDLLINHLAGFHICVVCYR